MYDDICVVHSHRFSIVVVGQAGVRIVLRCRCVGLSLGTVMVLAVLETAKDAAAACVVD